MTLVVAASPPPLVYLALGRASRLVLEACRGRRVLESFAYLRDVTDRYRPTWSGGMLDSGAFTELSRGVAIDLGAYIAFAQQHGAFYDALVSLDDIAGDVDRSRANFRRMLDAGLRPIPVFHQGEPWSVLDEVCAAAPDRYIGIGFQRPIRDGRRWLNDVFALVPAGVRVHGFAMTSHVERGLPFYSVDSSTWVHEWNALLGVKGQGADALGYLTPGEVLDIVLKKYDRLAARRAWSAAGATGELPGLSEGGS